MARLTDEQIDEAAEQLVAQREAQGLPRTVDNPEQLEALGRLIGAAIERQGQADKR